MGWATNLVAERLVKVGNDFGHLNGRAEFQRFVILINMHSVSRWPVINVTCTNGLRAAVRIANMDCAFYHRSPVGAVTQIVG